MITKKNIVDFLTTAEQYCCSTATPEQPIPTLKAIQANHQQIETAKTELQRKLNWTPSTQSGETRELMEWITILKTAEKLYSRILAINSLEEQNDAKLALAHDIKTFKTDHFFELVSNEQPMMTAAAATTPVDTPISMRPPSSEPDSPDPTAADSATPRHAAKSKIPLRTEAPSHQSLGFFDTPKPPTSDESGLDLSQEPNSEAIAVTESPLLDAASTATQAEAAASIAPPPAPPTALAQPFSIYTVDPVVVKKETIEAFEADSVIEWLEVHHVLPPTLRENLKTRLKTAVDYYLSYPEHPAVSVIARVGLLLVKLNRCLTQDPDSIESDIITAELNRQLDAMIAQASSPEFTTEATEPLLDLAVTPLLPLLTRLQQQLSTSRLDSNGIQQAKKQLHTIALNLPVVTETVETAQKESKSSRRPVDILKRDLTYLPIINIALNKIEEILKENYNDDMDDIYTQFVAFVQQHPIMTVSRSALRQGLQEFMNQHDPILFLSRSIGSAEDSVTIADLLDAMISYNFSAEAMGRLCHPAHFQELDKCLLAEFDQQCRVQWMRPHVMTPDINHILSEFFLSHDYPAILTEFILFKIHSLMTMVPPHANHDLIQTNLCVELEYVIMFFKNPLTYQQSDVYWQNLVTSLERLQTCLQSSTQTLTLVHTAQRALKCWLEVKPTEKAQFTVLAQRMTEQKVKDINEMTVGPATASLFNQLISWFISLFTSTKPTAMSRMTERAAKRPVTLAAAEETVVVPGLTATDLLLTLDDLDSSTVRTLKETFNRYINGTGDSGIEAAQCETSLDAALATNDPCAAEFLQGQVVPQLERIKQLPHTHTPTPAEGRVERFSHSLLNVLTKKGVAFRPDNIKPITLRIIPTTGDGSCFYHALATMLNNESGVSNNRHDYQSLRTQAADYLARHKSNVAIAMPEQTWGMRNFPRLFRAPTPEGYIERVRNTHEWADDLTIRALATTLRRQFVILRSDGVVSNIYPEFVPITELGEPLFFDYTGSHYSATQVCAASSCADAKHYSFEKKEGGNFSYTSTTTKQPPSTTAQLLNISVPTTASARVAQLPSALRREKISVTVFLEDYDFLECGHDLNKICVRDTLIKLLNDHYTKQITSGKLAAELSPCITKNNTVTDFVRIFSTALDNVEGAEEFNGILKEQLELHRASTAAHALLTQNLLAAPSTHKDATQPHHDNGQTASRLAMNALTRRC